MTAGRDDANDIHLYDAQLNDHANLTLSRFQCGFNADKESVFIEDFASTNGTLVSSPVGDTRIKVQGVTVKFAHVRHQKLKDGDQICLGPFILRFVQLQENNILD